MEGKKMTTDRTYFRQGDDVPTWMIDAKPKAGTKNYARPTIKFAVDCSVVFTRSGIFIVPEENSGDKVVSVNGGVDCWIFAASKDVIMPIRFEVIGGQPGANKPS
jgi:hypothetical protein